MKIILNFILPVRTVCKYMIGSEKDVVDWCAILFASQWCVRKHDADEVVHINLPHIWVYVRVRVAAASLSPGLT